jgi:phytanoyl-CoA hydroxylase
MGGRAAYPSFMGRIITDEQVQQYERNGFLVLPGFASRSACAELRAAAEQIVADFHPSEQRTVFTTKEQHRVSNGEFLSSGSGSWCFFEEDAFDERGQLTRAKELSINKIGHAMHDMYPAFEAFTYTTALADLATDLGMDQALVLQSMYIFKQPHIGGEVGCHQDATFLYTNPVTVTGFWFALEDATVHNGCLWVARGGHLTPLRKVFKRAGDTDHDGTVFEELDAAPLPDPSHLEPVEVSAGTLVVLHGLLPHWSDVNRSSRSRHAYSVHCIDANAEYPAWNWLQRDAAMPLRTLQGSSV